MTEMELFERAYSLLASALPLLDQLGVHHAAGDVSQAMSKLEHHELAAHFDLAAVRERPPLVSAPLPSK